MGVLTEDQWRTQFCSSGGDPGATQSPACAVADSPLDCLLPGAKVAMHSYVAFSTAAKSRDSVYQVNVSQNYNIDQKQRVAEHMTRVQF